MFAVVKTAIAPLMTKPIRECELADEALYGMKVELLEKEGDWFKIKTSYRYTGYTHRDCLLFEPPVAFEKAEKRVLLKPYADLMAEPEVQSYPLISVTRGAILGLTADKTEDGWCKVVLADGRFAWTRENYLGAYITAWDKNEEEQLRTAFVESAMAYLGTQYRWGGKTPLGIDCSGLVSMAYLLNGVVIYRDAHIKPEFCMHTIPYSEIKMGDLLFFPGHVAMYIADGKFIHSTSHKGDEGVVLASLKEGDPDFRGDLLRSMQECGSIF